MNNIDQESRSRLTGILQKEIDTASGRKALEYGSGIFSLAADLRDRLDYLACTDKSTAFLEEFRTEAEKRDIMLIPDGELGEDCYFGRFHLIWTVFGLRGQPRLVDEIMKLRRLILKGGKIVIIDFAADDFEAECCKQLKRCGFADLHTESVEISGESAFMIMAQK